MDLELVRRKLFRFHFIAINSNGRGNNEMGALLDKPKTDKYNEQGEWNGLRYGLSSMQGWRIEMEDAHCAVMGLPGNLKDWAFFAVFDGHAGERVSSHCADNLLETIIQTEQIAKCVNEEDVSIDEIKKGIRDGFLLLDDKMRTIPEMASGEDKSGSTAVCVLISPTQLYIANCGDSRSVLCRDGRVCFATQDHKPINPSEKERIQNAGGSVMIQRVNGSLAVSRALGDYEYKNVEGKGQCEQLVSPEPEISVESRDEVRDEFMVLACDGVWDVMSNEDLVEFIRSRLLITNDLASICNQVIDTCLYKGSRDNMSMVLVTFPACPPPVDEATKKEAQLEELLKNRVTELVKESDGNVELPHILQTLGDENISDLPPGGGLAAKRTFIESVYKVLCPNSADSFW
ncbi:protein phosphatase 1A isoform X2 [Folsomia candida]|uniref:protein phosphatase 1A isoform X2 n=1 Tax=Folsomia candida TaxID=158441 RepID=UPI000B8FEF8E|nr:protein phosphatase 1A isoform X2 [Folsomia candida]